MIAASQGELLLSIGLPKSKVDETIKNSRVTGRLIHAIEQFKLEAKSDVVDKKFGILLYQIATSEIKSETTRKFLAKEVAMNHISTSKQLKAAFDFFHSNISDSIDIKAFENACGIGVEYDYSEIEKKIDEHISTFKGGNNSKLHPSVIFGPIMNEFKFADTKRINEIITERIKHCAQKVSDSLVDFNKNEEQKSECKNGFQLSLDAIEKITYGTEIYSLGEASKFHLPGENYKSPEYQIYPNTMKHMEEHVKKYGNQVRTRFPPEPNGILHIGHAKAINFNFGYARAFGGITFLRYDDTNPEKEEEKFFHEIEDKVRWLGFEPYKITYSSDQFDVLYDFAIELIKLNVAYVCHQTPEEIKGRTSVKSAYRDRPIEESLKLFEDMKDGKFKAGEAVLRLKYVMEDGKLDPVAYRVLNASHHRTGNQWCIYPTYSYSHPICDSLEGITHSLCTKEFQNQRSFYYWLCNTLDIYCPVQWEYSRLNITNTIMSKRKILKLIMNGIVGDWDDPRLFTLSALKRRGVPPLAINYFYTKIGVTAAASVIDVSLLDSCTREVLNLSAPRVLGVLKPLEVVITNFVNEEVFEAPNFPNDLSKGSRKVCLSKNFFIEESDYCEVPSNDYKRLTLNQSVGLLHASKVICVKEVVKDKTSGRVTKLLCEMEQLSKTNKPKGFIHWVSRFVKCEVRLFTNLFFHENPDDKTVVPGGFLSDINLNSTEILTDCLIEESVLNSPVLTRFQFERVGYFAVDKDSTNEKLVFNRIITLRESK